MSENDIKPVAWVERNENGHDRMWSYALESWANRPENPEPLYDQAAIDRLSADAVGYKRIADEVAGILESAEGLIDRLTAERDAAVAKRGRYFCDGPEGHFFCDDLELARALVNTYDKDEDWTITDMLNPYGVGK